MYYPYSFEMEMVRNKKIETLRQVCLSSNCLLIKFEHQIKVSCGKVVFRMFYYNGMNESTVYKRPTFDRYDLDYVPKVEY